MHKEVIIILILEINWEKAIGTNCLENIKKEINNKKIISYKKKKRKKKKINYNKKKK